MNVSELPFDKRLEFEEKELKLHLLLSDKIIDSYVRFDNVFILQFNGFTLKCELYSNKRPNCYWVGPPPNHRFFKSTRSNIANTRFGIYFPWYTPDKMIIDIMERIKYSLTSKGEKEMEDGMRL
jgi:hypothetical protein